MIKEAWEKGKGGGRKNVKKEEARVQKRLQNCTLLVWQRSASPGNRGGQCVRGKSWRGW